MTLTEGEMQEICVVTEQTLERSVPFSISITLESVSSGKYYGACIHTGYIQLCTIIAK